MESLVFDVVDNDELLAEESTHVDLDESAAAADLLNTAIEAVHAAFPDKDKRPVKLAQKAGKEEELVLLGRRHSNQKLPRDPLFVLTTTESTEYTSPRRPRSGGGRTRMREQLIQLRSVVQKMEAHLETLRSPRSPRFEDCREYVDEEAAQTQEGCKEMSDEAAVWRNIAMQQFRARRKAEQQNSELRESLAALIQTSRNPSPSAATAPQFTSSRPIWASR